MDKVRVLLTSVKYLVNSKRILIQIHVENGGVWGQSYAEEFVPSIDEKGEVHQKYKKPGRVCHHILCKRLHYNMCEEG